MERITTVYVTNVRSIPDNVPFGIDLLGFFKSPDILAPLRQVSDNRNTHRAKPGCLREYSRSSRKQNTEQTLKSLF